MHSSCGCIGQKFDVPDALLQLVVCGGTALEQHVAVDRRLDAPGAAIEKPYAERMLEIGDHLGNRGGGNTEVSRCLGHAAVLNDRREDMQVPQLKSTAYLALPVDLSQH